MVLNGFTKSVHDLWALLQKDCNKIGSQNGPWMWTVSHKWVHEWSVHKQSVHKSFGFQSVRLRVAASSRGWMDMSLLLVHFGATCQVAVDLTGTGHSELLVNTIWCCIVDAFDTWFKGWDENNSFCDSCCQGTLLNKEGFKKCIWPSSVHCDIEL